MAANDIGAINFFADLHTVDLWGLGTIEVGKAKLARKYNTDAIDRITKNKTVAIAVVYDSWFTGEKSLPQSWRSAGSWEIINNVVCGSSIVSFYAVDPLEYNGLLNNLANFRTRLPEDVMQSGIYIGATQDKQ